MSLRAILVAGLLVLAHTGCRSTSRLPDLSVYDKGLALSVAPPISLPLHGTAELAVTLTNVSTARIQGCLGPDRGYHLFGTAHDFGHAGLTDHPTCKRPFDLEPGGTFSWSDAIDLGDIGDGPARLHYFVQVLAPEGCHPFYGCYGIQISAPLVPVSVLSPAPPSP